MYKRILVAIDDSFMTQRVLAEATALAKAHGAALCIAHAIDETILAHSNVESLAPTPIGEVESHLRQAAGAFLEKAAESVRAQGITPELKVVDSEKKHVSEILADTAEAWQADLLILGTHGRRGLERLFVGSVAERVVRRATCSVLLVRGE